jgi:flagellar hook-associated protein 3 FlgL
MLLERTTTSLLSGAMRNSTRQLQVDLQNAQIEMSTGRFADSGLVLGAYVGRNLDWRNEIERLQTSLKRNELQAERAKVTQAGIEAIKGQSTYLMNTIVGARSAANGPQLAKTAGQNALNGIMETLSTSYSGQYIFSGKTPDGKPLSSYVGQAPQGAFDAAFLAEFGFDKTDPLASGITPSQMQTFLQGRFEDLFKDPQWTSDWSTSSAENQLARIDAGQRRCECQRGCFPSGDEGICGGL